MRRPSLELATLLGRSPMIYPLRQERVFFPGCIVGYFPAATPRATVTTGGLNQVRASGVVCASTPGMSGSRTSHLPPLKKSFGGGDIDPRVTRVVLPLKQIRDPEWSSADVWDVRAALFKDRTACLLTEEGARKATTTAFTTPTTIIDGDSLLNCPQCDRTFTSRIGLLGHLRIHRTETGETVPGAATNSRDHPLFIAWPYSVTCASMTAKLTTMPTTPIHDAHPPLLSFLPPLPPPLP
ncbi:unnamed protein product [Schistocephalus solidus]|uniref:C2H2-type domain-containing protein n=1 Tax=Schistocephalus solidus TaxID=70667 RepID=A0A183SPW4_SCHSO|nr:unnamed protein product [Schistocephalus solidus]